MDGEKYSGVTREMLEKDVEKMFGLNEMNWLRWTIKV
jgi:hypothetical protein